MKGRTVFSPEKSKEFCGILRETGGNITLASERMGINRRTAYDWRKQHPEFADAWDEALTSSVEDLEEEAKRRAYAGVEEPVYYRGKVVGTIRRYSDTLLIFLLKAHRPERYREQIKFITQPEAEKAVDDAIQKHNLPAGTTVIDSTM